MSRAAQVIVPLPADTSAPGAARRAVRETLGTWRLDALEGDVSLLVSELTTNALLHAGRASEMRMIRLERGVRVEVCDPSHLLPRRRNYTADATTGRGLALLAALATRSGADGGEQGKCIWFEIDAGGGVETATELLQDATLDVTDCTEVTLRSLPVSLYRASQQQVDALVREVAIEAWTVSGGPDAAATAEADAAHSAVATQIAPLVDAASGPTVDAVVQVAPEVADGLRRLVGLLDVAEKRAAAGELLARPTLPEVRELRTWYLGEIVGQLEGRRAHPWLGVDVVRDDTDQLPVVQIDWDALGIDVRDAVVVGDEGNRIVAVTPGAAELLGWDAASLCGERIARIVPYRLREAHLAGFTRFLATGEHRIVGERVVVPALRADGSEVEVELALEVRRVHGGRTLFVANLRDASAPV